jgi:hypothetical protein
MNQGDPIKALKDEEAGIIALPFWDKETDLTQYEKSESLFDIEWSQTMHRIYRLENECLPLLVYKQYKAKTLCVYFREGKPYYVHRRSTKYSEHEWLVKVDEYNLEIYEKKLLTHHGKQYRLAKEQQKAAAEEAAEAAEAQKKAELKKLRNEALDKAYKLEKERLLKNAHDNWEREKAEVKKYIDTCMYQANAWLHGHTPDALRNQEAWRLAEQEEEEEIKNQK